MLREWRAAEAGATLRTAQCVSAADNPLTEKHGQCTDPGCAGLNEPLLWANLRLLLYYFPTWVKCSEFEEAFMKVGLSPIRCSCIYTQLLLLLYTKKPRDRRLSVSPPLFPPPSDARWRKHIESDKKRVLCPHVKQFSGLFCTDPLLTTLSSNSQTNRL